MVINGKSGNNKEEIHRINIIALPIKDPPYFLWRVVVHAMEVIRQLSNDTKITF